MKMTATHRSEMDMRRRLVWVLVICCDTIICPAQNGYLEDDPVWSGSCQWNPGGVEHCLSNEQFNYFIDGDSIVGDTAYKKLRKKGELEVYWYWWEQPPAWNCPVGITSYNDPAAALIRQEGSRLYFRDYWNPDQLLYDFDLQVGDTLPESYFTQDNVVIVTQRDTIEVGPYSRIRLELNDGADHLIEGIGGDHGLLGLFGDPGFGPFCGLSCFGYGDTAYYPETGPDCDLRLAIAEQHKDNSRLPAWPNPTSASVTVAPPLGSKTLELVDPLGRTQLLLHAPFRATVEVDLRGVNPGVFVMRVTDGIKELGRTRISVQ